MTTLKAEGPRQQCNTLKITYIFKETSRRSAIRLKWKWKVEIIRVKIRESDKGQIVENFNDMVRSAGFIQLTSEEFSIGV